MHLTHTTLLESSAGRVLGLTCDANGGCTSYVEVITPQKITFVRSGLFIRAADGEVTVADAGQLLFFDTREYRFTHPGRDGGNRCTVIEVSPDLWSELSNRCRYGNPGQVAAPRDWMRRHYQLLAHLNQTRSEPSVAAEALSLALVRAAFIAASHCPSRAQSRSSAREAVRRQRVQHARLILHGSLRSPPALSDLARVMGCSPFHLSRAFTEQSGMTIRQYIACQRAQAAAERILAGTRNLAALALDLGLYDQAHLCRIFGRVWGMSPSVFRDRYASVADSNSVTSSNRVSAATRTRHAHRDG